MKCIHCGGTALYYDRQKQQILCYDCRRPPRNDLQEMEAQQKYDKAYSAAMDHLRAGNFDRAIGMLKPLTEQKPGDTRLYEALFRAATSDYSDFAVTESRKKVAMDAWNHARQLRSVSPQMIRYIRMLRSKREEEKAKNIRKLLIWLVIVICAFAISLSDADGAFLAGIVVLFGIWRIIAAHPIEVFNKCRTQQSDYEKNPFQ